jgi:acetyl-CoA synthetase
VTSFGTTLSDLRRSFRWDDVTRLLDWNPSIRLNLAHEACDRWAVDRGRVALQWVSARGDLRTYTYFDLARLSNRLANVLRALGVSRGDRVAALMPRVPETIVASLATWKLGAVFVPLFSGFGPEAIGHRLRTSEVRAVFVEQRFRGLLAAGLHADVPIIVVAGERGTGIRRGDLSFWGEADAADPFFSIVETVATEASTILFTSGTTGPPKGCVIPHGALVGLIPFVQHVLALRPDDLMWATADPGWSFGLFTTGAVPMALGFPRLMYEGDFDAGTWWRICNRYQVTHLTAAPTAYRALAAAGVKALPESTASVVRATSAGEPLNPEPLRWMATHAGFEVHDAYGLTEVGMVIANPRGVEHKLRPGSMGQPIPGYDVSLRTEQGATARLGEPGRIVVRRHPWFLSSGYWGMDTEWAARWQDDWFVTEDTAIQDEAGYFWFVGRQDDVIISAGMNVGPFEIESVLVSHDGVAEAAVVAKPDPRRGHVVKAYVVLRSEERATPALTEALQALVRERVGKHAWPREIEFVPCLPRTESGKIQRGLLRQRASAETTESPAKRRED